MDRLGFCPIGLWQFVRALGRAQGGKHLVDIVANTRALSVWNIRWRVQIGEPSTQCVGAIDSALLPAVPTAADQIDRERHAICNFVYLRFAHRTIEVIGRRHQPDHGQHDEADALLSVVGTVGERNAGAGQKQQTAHPRRRRPVTWRRFENASIGYRHRQYLVERKCQAKAENRRYQKRANHARDLLPIDSDGQQVV